MQLSASNRREVIEDLLDIKIFSQMNSVLKDKTKIVKDEIKQLEYKLMTLEENQTILTIHIMFIIYQTQ